MSDTDNVVALALSVLLAGYLLLALLYPERF
jgi:K+-transporting ATPase KdpF subunit